MTALGPWPTWATERVEIVRYDPSWPRRAALHIARLNRLLARWLTQPIEHVGSTAIPGLPAKPIIDLQAAVVDLAATDRITERLAPDGWHPVPVELDQRPWRRLYVLPENDRRAAHLHVLSQDSPRWHEQLTFRDALRADPGLVAEYADLKTDLSAQHAEDREAYTRGKTSFVRRIVRSAAEEQTEDYPAPPAPGTARDQQEMS